MPAIVPITKKMRILNKELMSNLLPVKVAFSSIGSGCANTSLRVSDDSANIHTLKTVVLSRDT